MLQRRQGQPLSLALVAMELARRLDIPLVGVNFPGRFLLRVPQADHLLDPATGRRLYTPDCRELLLRLQGPKSELQAAYLKQASPGKSSSVCRATCDNCTAPPASRWPR